MTKPGPLRAAVTTSESNVEIRDTAAVVPGPRDVLVTVERVGLCGSDIHLFSGDHPYSNYPLVQGHEFSGVIAEIGSDVDGPLTLGDRVAIEPFTSCGSCYPCRTDHPNCCENIEIVGVHRSGALQTQIVVPAAIAHSIGDLSADLGTLCEPVSIALQAVTRAAVVAGEFVLVLGAGPIGQGIVLATSELGADVMVSDLAQNRLDLARHLGATETVLASGDDNLAQRVEQWTNGDGPAVVFDATGASAVIRSGFNLVAASGRLVIVGLSNDDVSLPIVEFTRRELTVLGSRLNTGLFPEAVELVKRNADRIGAMITQRYSLEDAQQALTFAHDHPAEAIKVLIEVSEA